MAVLVDVEEVYLNLRIMLVLPPQYERSGIFFKGSQDSIGCGADRE